MKICQQGAKICNKTFTFEVSTGFCPSFGLSHQKTPCYRSLVNINQHGAEIFNKTCSFQFSIELVLLISSSWQQNPCYHITLCPDMQELCVNRKTMDRQRQVKTLPVHCTVGKVVVILVCICVISCAISLPAFLFCIFISQVSIG